MGPNRPELDKDQAWPQLYFVQIFWFKLGPAHTQTLGQIHRAKEAAFQACSSTHLTGIKKGLQDCLLTCEDPRGTVHNGISWGVETRLVGIV